MVLPLRKLTAMSQEIAAGNLIFEDIRVPKNEIGLLKEGFKEAVTSLQRAESDRDRNAWLKNGQASLEKTMRGDQALEALCKNIITFIAGYLKVQIGALYVDDGEGVFKLTASYAYQSRKGLALEKQSIVITDVPDDYIAIASGLGKKSPRTILVVPLIYNDQTVGVVEFGSFRAFTELQVALLEEVAKAIAIAINSAQARVQLQKAFERTQQQAEELQAQQEELKTANEELEEQTQKLQVSEEELRSQQEELRVTNEELEEKTQSLEAEKKKVTEKNQDLEAIQKDLKQKAKELEVTSRYKSEFLANMSHELRTPLNSLLILSQDLSANRKKNLSDDQVEAATIIHKSGEDLLNLINEILDLSKIEAGRMDIQMAETPLSDIGDGITAKFRHLAENKGLEVAINLGDDLPEAIQTDRQRLDQILSNLMANAIKFTGTGGVTVDIHRPDESVNLSRSGIQPQKVVAISVTDTGIGIPEDKQLEIFEAFQQADGSTSRVYGGTGLGLSISRELARLLGGEIQLQSEVGKGSTFTIYLPVEGVKREIVKRENVRFEDGKREGMKRESRIMHYESIPDDRDRIGEGDRAILVIEDDPNFAKTLYRFCHERDFRCVHAADGKTGLEMAGTYRPDAIILDIRLPGLEGWGVLEALKSDTRTRHIPVHMMSVEEESIDAYRKGAIGYLTKPASTEQLEKAFLKIEDMIERNIKNLLIVEDNPVLRKEIVRLIGNGDVKTTAVGTGKEAVQELTSNVYDCVILDLKLPDISGFDVLKRLDTAEDITIPPIIVYTGKELTREEGYQLQKYAASIIVKGVKSQERLLDETALFLHRVVDNLPDTKKKIISALHDGDTLFQGKKVLVADDDMRNVFAISRILEEKGMKVFKAPDGQKALDIMDKEAHMDLILMDIMMPVMDGYEAIRRIREQERFQALPILAVTAKAMPEDRDKCVAAGANDYLPKPVDIERLLSLMRVWLYK
ncbi:MAG: response regulator [Deltaproteobacteria bacterium]|nr:response regulator [Deltaproteobacteria bacterium]